MNARDPSTVGIQSVQALSTARARSLSSRTTIGVLAELLAVVTVSGALHDQVDPRRLLLWWGVMAATGFLRLGHWMVFRSTSAERPARGLLSDRWLAWCWAAAGLGWGMLPILLFPLESAVREGMVLMVVCANVVLALEVLHASRNAMLAYAIPTVLVPAVQLTLMRDSMRGAFAALLVVFLALVMFGFARRHRAYEATLVTRIQNQQLLGELAHAERGLRETIEAERLIFETALAGIAIVKDRELVRCNRRMEETFGFPQGSLTGASTRVLFESDADWQAAIGKIVADLTHSGVHDEERAFQRHDGAKIWCRYRGQIIDAANPGRGSIWVFEDLTEQRRAAQEMRRSEAEVALAAERTREANDRLVEAIACVPDAFALFDRDDRLVICNDQYAACHPGAPLRTLLIGKSFEDLLVESIQAGEPVPEPFKRNLPAWVAEVMGHHRNPGEQDLVYQAGDGRWWQVRERRTSDGGTVVLRSDISALKRSEERVRHLANHDPLTGLPNRRLLEDRLKQACNFARRSGEHVGVMLVDLDRFKIINDEHGHDAGDRVLREIARRLRESVREVDTVARHGGDEFVVVLPELRHPEDAGRIARKVIVRLTNPILADGKVFEVGASIGISIYPADATDSDALLKEADAAMYRAKTSGRGGFEFVSIRQPVQPELELG